MLLLHRTVEQPDAPNGVLERESQGKDSVFVIAHQLRDKN